MPAGISIIMTMSERGTRRGAAESTPPNPPACGLGPLRGPSPQGEGEYGVLHLLTWLSPAFPTGAYAYSHGLEWAVEDGDVVDGDTLRGWLADVLVHGSGRNDAILLRYAHAGGDLAALNELAIAIAPSRERRVETLDQGTAFVAAAAAWKPPRLPARVAYPVAVGAMAGHYSIDKDITAAAYLQAFAANLISAAVRLVPLGQSTGLRVLAALEPSIQHLADITLTATLDDLGSCTFRSDLAAMRHETQYTRLFRS
jgi:urease accessory protein